MVVELTPESSASSTVRLEDLQATQALSGVRPGSSDESSLDSTPEGHVETLGQGRHSGGSLVGRVL